MDFRLHWDCNCGQPIKLSTREYALGQIIEVYHQDEQLMHYYVSPHSPVKPERVKDHILDTITEMIYFNRLMEGWEKCSWRKPT